MGLFLMLETVIFTHIPKTAGTSIKESVFYPNLNVYEYKGIRDLVFKFEKVEFLDGHCPYGVHKYTSSIKNPRYFTTLRDPVSRCLSFYYNTLTWNKHRGYDDANNKNVIGFYEIPEYQNEMARRLAGPWANKIGSSFDLNETVLGDIVFLNAKRNLNLKYEAVGFTSRFEETVNCFAGRLGVEKEEPVERYQSVPGRRRKSDLSDLEIEKIRSLNRVDVRIYNYAQKRFGDKLQS